MASAERDMQELEFETLKRLPRAHFVLSQGLAVYQSSGAYGLSSLWNQLAYQYCSMPDRIVYGRMMTMAPRVVLFDSRRRG